MNKTLDSFESALLLELRQHVAEHPSPEPVRVRRPRRRLRIAALGATGVAASVVAVFGLGGTGGSPAYAVAENSAGDVIVTVHRLDDAAGLEQALLAKGIDADVSYDPSPSDGTFSVEDAAPDADAQLPELGSQSGTDGDRRRPSRVAGVPSPRPRPFREARTTRAASATHSSRRPPSLKRAMTGCSRSPPAHRCSRTTGISTSVPASTAR